MGFICSRPEPVPFPGLIMKKLGGYKMFDNGFKEAVMTSWLQPGFDAQS